MKILKPRYFIDFNGFHKLLLLVSDVHSFTLGLCISGRYVCLAPLPTDPGFRNLREDT